MSKITRKRERKYDAFGRGYSIPALLECDCGHNLELTAFTNTCVCGTDFNMSGQRLAPRSQWGEETGESVSEILAIGHNDASEGDFRG